MSAQDLAIKDIGELEELEEQFWKLESDGSMPVEELSRLLSENAHQRNAVTTRLLDYGQKRTQRYQEISQEVETISAHTHDRDAFDRLRGYINEQRG